VRLSGQDSGRGTFSQRHAKLFDQESGEPYVPLAHLRDGQAPVFICDSQLSEFAVLGFEYGYSVKQSDALVLWEAQFGDFANGAQVIIDQFIASAEEKWDQPSSLSLLLPHGYEGQGPEHSSARIERFLQLAARGSLRVCYPSTPASYFHLLRRQALAPEKRPLILFTPKSLLRHPEAVSPLAALTESSFLPLLPDPVVDGRREVRRVLLTAGKVAYDLLAFRRAQQIDDVTILRLEQFYPFPAAELTSALQDLGRARDVVWVQEEPRNMGAWGLLRERLPRCLAAGQELRYVGRSAAAAPATGSLRRHAAEQQALVAEAFGVPAPLSATAGAREAGAPPP
jgi:2-oxoglutarate dehydrogenase complex dehydrogenase (E1) component-like enzyme